MDTLPLPLPLQQAAQKLPIAEAILVQPSVHPQYDLGSQVALSN